MLYALVNNNSVNCDVIDDVDNISAHVSFTSKVSFDDLVKHVNTDDIQPRVLKKVHIWSNNAKLGY